MLALALTGATAAARTKPRRTAGPPQGPPPTRRPTTSAQVLARGSLVGFHEHDYPPQSCLVENGERDTSTKCAADGLTAAEIGGYDADTGKLVAEALGAEACKLGVEALGAEACFVAAVLLDTGFAG